MSNKISILLLAAATTALASIAPAFAGVAEIEDVLSRYVEDYASDPMRFDSTFGIEVAGQWWTVEVEGNETRLMQGTPAEPTYYYTITEEETLHRIDRGEYNMLTAMAKEFSTDVTPADLEVMEGFEPGADFMMTAVPQIFHFWTRGMPEIVPFSEEHALPTHGAHTVIIYYQPGFRSGWGYLAPGAHANADPRSRVNPFPSLFIVLQGTATARINGVDTDFEEGHFMIVPPGVSHEFLNNTDSNVHFLLFMFGEGA